MKKRLSAFYKLSRINEYGYLIIISTLFGVATAQGSFSWRWLWVLSSNFLALGFSYMVNDIEDAAVDALSTRNSQRNPISSGSISPKNARLLAVIAGLISAGLFAMLGLWSFVFGTSILLVGFLYSFKAIRLKSIPLINNFSHGALLGGLPFLSGYFSFTSTLNRIWYWPFLWLFTVSILFNLQHKSFNGEKGSLSPDQEIEAPPSKKYSNLIETILVVMAAATGIVSLFLINLLPLWVVLTMFVSFVFLVVPIFIKERREKTSSSFLGLMIYGVERALAVGLMAQFLLPWLVRFFIE